MMKMKFNLCLLLFLVLSPLLISVIAQEGRYEPRHSFKSPFTLMRTGNIANWEATGSTLITEEYVRLTPAVKSRVGAMWNLVPVHFRNWEVIIEFRIGGGGKLGADGMAFWFTPDFKQEGPVFGMKDQWRGLGIFFDTFDNDGLKDNPQVSAVLNDGSREWREDGRGIQFDGCHANFRNPYQNSKARIRYFNGDLEIFMDTQQRGWEGCARAAGVEFYQNSFFGLTAATGGLHDNHDVYSFEAYNLDEPQYDQQQQQYDHQQQQQQQQQQYEQQQQDQQQQQQNDQQQNQFNDIINKLNALQDDNQQQNQQDHQQQQQQQQEQQPPQQQWQPPQQQQQQEQQPPQQQQQQWQQPPQQQPPPPQQQQWQPPQQQPPQQQHHQQQPPQQQYDPELTNSLKDITTLLNDINNKVKSINVQGSNNAQNFEIKNSLDNIKAQQKVIAEAFGDLLQGVATKAELENAKSHSENLYKSIAKDLSDTRAVVNDLKAVINTKLGTKNDDIIRTLENVNQNVDQLKKNVEQTKESTKQIAGNLQQNAQDIATTIEKNSTFGFWTYFLFVQAIFIFGYIWYRKHRDDTNKKLI